MGDIDIGDLRYIEESAGESVAFNPLMLALPHESTIRRKEPPMEAACTTRSFETTDLLY